MTALNATAVNVSWNALDIPDFSIDHYTVLYSRVESQRRRRQDGAIQFSSNATSGVIAGLDSTATYQFQVFATGTLNGTLLEGERQVFLLALPLVSIITSSIIIIIINITFITSHEPSHNFAHRNCNNYTYFHE